MEYKMTFINCTPHPVNVVDGETLEVTHSFPKGEVVPRLAQSTKQVDVVDGIPITETVFGETQDLPDPKDGTLLIVSRLILSANPHRSDLVVPNGVVRDADGNIKGCASFARN